jgi:hypothetical protein
VIFDYQIEVIMRSVPDGSRWKWTGDEGVFDPGDIATIGMNTKSELMVRHDRLRRVDTWAQVYHVADETDKALGTWVRLCDNIVELEKLNNPCPNEALVTDADEDAYCRVCALAEIQDGVDECDLSPLPDVEKRLLAVGAHWEAISDPFCSKGCVFVILSRLSGGYYSYEYVRDGSAPWCGNCGAGAKCRIPLAFLLNARPWVKSAQGVAVPPPMAQETLYDGSSSVAAAATLSESDQMDAIKAQLLQPYSRPHMIWRKK